MAKLSVTSGSISLNDLRSHFGDTNAISMADFRTGGDKLVNVLDAYDYNGTKYVTTAGQETFLRIRTSQSATGENGTGTVTTTTNQYWHMGVSSGLPSFGFTDPNGQADKPSWHGTNYIHFIGGAQGKYPIGNTVGLQKQGTLQSAGSYSAWQNNYGFKDIFVDSTRFKDDYYSVILYDVFTRLQVANANPAVPTSGPISFDDLYAIDNGILWKGNVTVGEIAYAGTTYRGYGDSNEPTGAYGAVDTSTTIEQVEGVIQTPSAITLNTIRQNQNPANKGLDLYFRTTIRTTSAGSISNTSTSNISNSRFGAAFNHTGFGYTDTTAVWSIPTSLDTYDWYRKRNLNWDSVQDNTVRTDDGHAGWLLPTKGPTLLQVRGENENGNPFLSNVRFTPNSLYAGKWVGIMAHRTRQKGGVTGFSCSGATSGNFSGLSNSDGAPIVRFVKLPASGYISFSATGSGTYTGTNRIVQITVFDPFQFGHTKDGNFVRQVLINGTTVFDTTTYTGTDPHGHFMGYSSDNRSFYRLDVRDDIGLQFVTGNTLTVEIRR